jgi:signal transduction histidine kinase
MIVVLFFVAFHTNPELLGATLMRFTYFALLSLLLPFALSSAMDNLKLYSEKIEAERKHHNEEEQIRQDLHDNILNNLAKITMLSEMSLQMYQKGDSGVEEKLKSIKAFSSQYSHQIRELLCVTEERFNTWSDFCDNLRKFGNELIKDTNLDFDLCLLNSGLSQTPPPASIKVCLYYIFKETLFNIIKHATARSVNCTLFGRQNAICLEIKDDGKGFDPGQCSLAANGLKNIKNRVAAFKGKFSIDSACEKGTCLKVHLPLA